MVKRSNLTKDEQHKLSAALKDAEARTSARLASVVVRVSDRYALYPLVYGAVLGLTALGILALLLPSLPLLWGFCAAVGGFALAAFALEWMTLRLMLIPKRAKHWECWELAHRSFAARILAQTDRKIGILIFVSLGERYIEVVTDRDVDLHIPQSVWDAIIREFLIAAKKKRVGEGLIAAVQAATKVLEEQYPKG